MWIIKVVNALKCRLKYFLHKINDIKIAIIQVVLKKNEIPVSIYIEPTNICNANCIFAHINSIKHQRK